MYKRILMPTDGSACSIAAIREGLELAKVLGAEVTFLYALEDPSATVYAMPEVIAYQPQLYEDLKKAAHVILNDVQRLADDANVPAITKLVQHSSPQEAILEAEKEADLVVMGTHGRRGFNRFMFGSVAEGVLRRAETPYLLIRNPDKS
jgi:nucleotide-binding universal stress UspA family protein